MTTKQITITMLLTSLTICAGWDVYVASNTVTGDTISEITLQTVRHYPGLAFLLGCLLGHLVWSSKKQLVPQLLQIAAACFVIALAIAIDLVPPFEGLNPVIPFAVGVVTGHILWGQVATETTSPK